MFKQQNYLALGAVVLVAVLILSLPPRASARLRLAVSSWFLPLFSLTNVSQQAPAKLADNGLSRHELLVENNRLNRENEQLKVETVQAAAIQRENDQLRALIGWQRQAPWRLKLARVVTRDPANWWHTVQIDMGSRDGLTNNLPVITPDGLVGRISSVGLYTAQVVLVGDPNCRVSALVQDTTHDMGVLTRSGSLDTSLVKMSYLSSSANLKAGQDVVTSGMGGVFPPGIPIGKIVDAQTVEFGLASEARVKLNVNLGALEDVFILFP